MFTIKKKPPRTCDQAFHPPFGGGPTLGGPGGPTGAVGGVGPTCLMPPFSIEDFSISLEALIMMIGSPYLFFVVACYEKDSSERLDVLTLGSCYNH